MPRSYHRLFILMLILLITGCGGTTFPAGRVQKIVISSTFLQRGMRVNVYTPYGYNPDQKYPVLYVIHGYTATEDMWMPYSLTMNSKADQLIAENQIQPVIIVAPEMDNSFGVNSSTTPGKTVSGGLSFDTGRYEDYFFQELIPYIDANYSTITSRDGRCIGGISMGGFIALFYAFAHHDLFSKVGGHSPAIMYPEGYNIQENSIDSALENFLYPNITLRHERDPYYLIQTKDLSQMQVYLDAGDNDPNRIECGILFNILQAKGVPSENHVSPGGHDMTYWSAHIGDYLKFYAGVSSF